MNWTNNLIKHFLCFLILLGFLVESTIIAQGSQGRGNGSIDTFYQSLFPEQLAADIKPLLLNYSNLTSFFSNELCHRRVTYFMGCINGINEVLQSNRFKESMIWLPEDTLNTPSFLAGVASGEVVKKFNTTPFSKIVKLDPEAISQESQGGYKGKVLFINKLKDKSLDYWASITLSQNIPYKLDFDEVITYISQELTKDNDNTELTTIGVDGFLNIANYHHAMMLSSVDDLNDQSWITEEKVGIGTHLLKDQKTKMLIVLEPIPRGPADQAGIEPYDYISKIDGQSVKDELLITSIKRMQGPLETELKLTILRGGQSQELTVIRNLYPHPNVLPRVIPLNQQIIIGYLQISSFMEKGVAAKTLLAIRFLQRQNVAAIILDLRIVADGTRKLQLLLICFYHFIC